MPASSNAAISPEKLAALRGNIFAAAHAAIADWHVFPWHRDMRGHVQADKPHSSQALAIDVFGAIGASNARDAILDTLAIEAGLPPGGPWNIELEWTDAQRLLREPRPTQVDALAVGAHAIMVIECKFTEPGGSCSQTRRIQTGPGAGQPQCSGRYELQVNPRSNAQAHCALSGKGIRYWDVIPAIFDLDAATAYAPCPFKGETFQWMRNLALAHELGRNQRKAAACVVAYASGGDFPTETKADNLAWLPPLADGARGPVMASYQRIVELAAETDGDPCWGRLADWIARKVELARRR
jgi:hypothetical protein